MDFYLLNGFIEKKKKSQEVVVSLLASAEVSRKQESRGRPCARGTWLSWWQVLMPEGRTRSSLLQARCPHQVSHADTAVASKCDGLKWQSLLPKLAFRLHRVSLPLRTHTHESDVKGANKRLARYCHRQVDERLGLWMGGTEGALLETSVCEQSGEAWASGLGKMPLK